MDRRNPTTTSSGTYPLNAITTPTVTIACTRCLRRGRYRLATLIARYGADMPAADLLRIVSADCPARAKASPMVHERCDPHFVGLVTTSA
jgi:hypothetical protein